MSERALERIETAVDTLAASLFAGAIAFAAASLLRGQLDSPQWEATAIGALIVCYAGCKGLLRKVAAAHPHFILPVFELAPIETVELGELLLTEADRFPQGSNGNGGDGELLVLDDILAEIDPDSRVVHLFDRAAMPTAGQLKSRIDRHLDEGVSAIPPDASEALFEALAELRRSLA